MAADPNTPAASQGDAAGDMPPADLSHAGAIVDKAIEYMMGQNLSQMAVASALLGGSLGLLARNMSDDALVQVLQNAIHHVRSGELRAEYGPHEGAAGGGASGRA